MPKIRIDGVGVVNVDDSFLDLSPEEQNETIEEIAREAKRSSPPQGVPPKDKKYDWISDVTGTIGAIAGGFAGGAAGVLAGPAAPAAIPLGAAGGGAAGGAAGGALGEWIEGFLDPQGRRGDEVFDTAVTEAAFGLIPGAGGVLTKAGLRGGARTLGLIPKMLGFTVKTPGEAVLKGVSKLSPNQLDAFFTKKVLKKMDPRDVPQLKKLGIKDLRSLQVLLADQAKRKQIIKAFKGNKKFEALINEFYKELAQKGVTRQGAAASLIARTGIDEANIQYGTSPEAQEIISRRTGRTQ